MEKIEDINNAALIPESKTINSAAEKLPPIITADVKEKVDTALDKKPQTKKPLRDYLEYRNWVNRLTNNLFRMILRIVGRKPPKTVITTEEIREALKEAAKNPEKTGVKIPQTTKDKILDVIIEEFMAMLIEDSSAQMFTVEKKGNGYILYKTKIQRQSNLEKAILLLLKEEQEEDSLLENSAWNPTRDLTEEERLNEILNS